MVTSEPPPALLAPHLRKANQAAPLGAWSLWRTIGPSALGGWGVERAERAIVEPSCVLYDVRLYPHV